MTVLELKKVSFTYENQFRSVMAVRGADFSFEKGKSYAIIGKSGSGKSTLLSLLAGFQLPTEGHVICQGKATDDMNLEQYRREKVSVIHQAFHLFPKLTVLENVMYPMELMGIKLKIAEAKARAHLQEVGLGEEYCFRFPAMLSGGEQQRVAIARALGAGTNILLADEPTGNLDKENSKMVLELMLKLSREMDYAVIIVTHDLELAKQVDVVLQMQDGVLNSLDTFLGA